MGKNDTKSKAPKAKVAAAKTKSPVKKCGGAKTKGKSGKNAEQVIMEALATFLVRGNDTPERSKVRLRYRAKRVPHRNAYLYLLYPRLCL